LLNWNLGTIKAAHPRPAAAPPITAMESLGFLHASVLDVHAKDVNVIGVDVNDADVHDVNVNVNDMGVHDGGVHD
jgi:hypothetical protein